MVMVKERIIYLNIKEKCKYMPIDENYPNANIPEENEVANDWQALAEDAAENWDLEHPGVAALYENHVVPKIQDTSTSQKVLSLEDKAGSRFLHKYGNVDTKEVHHVVGYLRSNGETIADKAGDRTAGYLDFMVDTVNDGILTGDRSSIKRQINAHIIKSEEVPESYFDAQQRIARERGHGDVDIDRDQLVEAIISDQRSSLNKWVEYLGGDDGSYPDWFKRYTWDSVIKLGTFDKERNKFNKRETTTVAPYPELNREALANVYDTIKKFHVLGDAVEDTDLKQILNEGSFSRIYAHAMLIANPEAKELTHNIQGKWKKYAQTKDSRTARRLSGSVAGNGTGWCITGESTAKDYLNDGDFYVYYSFDEDGAATIPRTAIRMKNGSVAEVRGILNEQELEPALFDITIDKLQGLQGGAEYMQKAEDMKRLTNIENRIKSDPQQKLTKDDLAFLYEIDHIIKGFGYERDPRIDDLIEGRNLKKDIEEITGIDLDNFNSSETIVRLLEDNDTATFYYLLRSKYFHDINSETLKYIYDCDLVDRKHFDYISQIYSTEYHNWDIKDYKYKGDYIFAVILADNIESFSNIGIWATDILLSKLNLDYLESVFDKNIDNFDNFDSASKLSIIKYFSYERDISQLSEKWRVTEMYKKINDSDLAKLTSHELLCIAKLLDEDGLIGKQAAKKLGKDLEYDSRYQHLLDIPDNYDSSDDNDDLAHRLGYVNDDNDYFYED